jgi:hypothetical protein
VPEGFVASLPKPGLEVNLGLSLLEVLTLASWKTIDQFFTVFAVYFIVMFLQLMLSICLLSLVML